MMKREGQLDEEGRAKAGIGPSSGGTENKGTTFLGGLIRHPLNREGHPG